MKHIDTAKFAIVSAVAATSVYLTMIFWTLDHLRTVAGAPPFDMRPFGYSGLEARQLLTALGEQGRNFYLTHQIPLDLIYPTLLALTLVSLLRLCARKIGQTRLIQIGILATVFAAAFDYLENALVAAMLFEGPGTTEILVRFASSATMLKSLTTTGALLILLLVCINVLKYPCRRAQI